MCELKFMVEKTSVDKIKQNCMNILSNKSILSNCNAEFLEKYKSLYQIKQIQAVLNSEELISTAKILLQNDLNITMASKQGYMHRNTLIYRIEKIKRLIGLDIRVFRDAIVFENLVLFYEMLKNK